MGRPCASTWRPDPTGYASWIEGSPSARASASRSAPGAGASLSSITRRATEVRARHPRTHAKQTPSTSTPSAAACPYQRARSDAIIGEVASLGAVSVGDGDESEVRDERQEHGRGEDPGGGRRARDPPRSERSQRGCPDQAGDEADPRRRLDEAGIARDADEVVRALRASLCDRVERERRNQPERHERAHVGKREHRAFEPAGDEAAGVGERRMRDDRRACRVREQPDREQQRGADPRVVVLDQEPCAARGREDRPEAARGPARPGDRAARQQRPTGPEEHQPRMPPTRRRAIHRGRCGRSAPTRRRVRCPGRARPDGATSRAYLLTTPHGPPQGIPLRQDGAVPDVRRVAAT